MTNTTETYWAVDGVSLQTLAQNITTLGDDRLSVPPVRGSNLVVPHRRGSLFMPKEADERSISLGMWVQGCAPDGTIPASMRRQFDKNWRALQRLLFTPHREFVLSKRFWVDEDDLAGMDFSGLPSDGNGYRLLTASTNASYGGGMAPSMTGVGRASFAVDLVLTDPYFYSDEIAVSLGLSNQSFSVPGDARTTKINVDLAGDLDHPQVFNLLSSGYLYLEFNSTVAAASTVTLDVDNFRAQDGSGNKVAGYITHGGSNHWLYMDPGTVTLQAQANAGSGGVTVRYQPAWF